jgi:hypothetical protein
VLEGSANDDEVGGRGAERRGDQVVMVVTANLTDESGENVAGVVSKEDEDGRKREGEGYEYGAKVSGAE